MSKSGWTMSLNLNMLDTDNGQQKTQRDFKAMATVSLRRGRHSLKL